MTDILKEGIGALFGTLGFSLIFGLRKNKLIVAMLGGFSVWVIYATVRYFVPSDAFLCNFIGALFGTFFSQIMARLLKAPATLFLFPAIIVLVPGGMLYYTMSNIILGNTAVGFNMMLETIKVTVALAFGIVIAMATTKIIYFFSNKKFSKKTRKK